MKMRKFSDGGETVDDGNEDRLGDFIKSKGLDKDKPLPVDTVAEDELLINDDMRAKTSPAAKTPIVTKEELAKSGLSLRDYMNKQQGLQRRNAPPPKVRETTVEDVFPVLTGEKKRAEEKMDKKQFRAEQNAQIIAREAAKAKAKESETRTSKRAGNLTDMLGLSSRYASGGSVSASRRGDGIAQRGKTRGRVC